MEQDNVGITDEEIEVALIWLNSIISKSSDWHGHEFMLGLPTVGIRNFSSIYQNNIDSFRNLKKDPDFVFENPIKLLNAVCSKCEYHIPIFFDGHNIIADKCCRPDEVPAPEFELNVPSGYLIVSDDLRGNGFELSYSVGNLNNDYTLMDVPYHYANIGMAHAFVGNSSPRLYRIKGTDTYVIRDYIPEADWDEDYHPETSYEKEPENYEKLAQILTGLWWYSIVDYDEFLKRGNTFESKEDSNLHKVAVKPGVYRFHHQPLPPYQTTFTWIRDPDPETGLLVSYPIGLISLIGLI